LLLLYSFDHIKFLAPMSDSNIGFKQNYFIKILC